MRVSKHSSKYYNSIDKGCQEPDAEVGGIPVSGSVFDRCRDGCRGRSCLKCQAGRYDVLPFTRSNGYESGEYYEHRRKQFMVRAYRGVECGTAKGYRFRVFTLSESDEALRAGIDFGSEFHRFVRWLRYHCPSFEYVVVAHRQGVPSVVTGQQRCHRHVLSYGSDMLPVEAMRAYWQEHYLSTVTGMKAVWGIAGAIKYLAGYLSSRDKFVRSWQSQGWVFRGWLGMTKAYKRSFGDYVDGSELSRLSLMSPEARESEIGWLLNTGYQNLESCEAGQVRAGSPQG